MDLGTKNAPYLKATKNVGEDCGVITRIGPPLIVDARREI